MHEHIITGKKVRDDPKLPDDSNEVPNPKGVVGNLNPSYQIVSLLDGKLDK
jgi:hypothetical protein